VEVEDHHRRLRARFVDERIDHLPRRDGRVEEERPEEVEHRDFDAVARFDDGESSPERQRAGVRGANDALARREVAADSVAPVGVIAERDDIGAGGEQTLSELRCDARSVRDVLAVDDADVGAELFAQTREAPFDRPAPRDAEDVGEEEDSQLRTSAAAGRSSTDT
jgi:hypothetical protein